MAQKSRRAGQQGQFSWPKRALALFFAIFLVVFGLIMFTGNKSFAPRLGIDLQGGTRVTLVPQGQDPTKDQLNQARDILERRVNGMGVSGAEVVIDGKDLVITVPGDDAAQARAIGRTSQLLFRPVLAPSPTSGGFPNVVESMANDWVKAGIITPEEANKHLKQVVEALPQMGVENPPKELTVSAKAPAEPKDSIEEQARRDEQVKILKADRQSDNPDKQFAAAALLTCEGPDALAGADDPAKPLVACSADSPMVLGPAPLLVGQEDNPNGQRLTGEMIDTNSPITGGLDPSTQQMAITFRFKTGEQTPGGETWYKLGQEMLNRQVAITLDSEVVSAPTIQGPTPPGETSQITGNFTDQEAKDLANNLRYGALPLSFVGQNGETGGTATTISPTLGAASLQAGIIAGIVGLVLVSLYALAYYRALGFVAIFSLVAALGLVYGSIVLLGRWIGYSLDLAGVAGLIIGLGTTADSFVIYFERIKDEIRSGFSFRSAVPRAWKRARSTIITGNIVSLIAAVILYFLAVGDVKGFAFTLGLTTFFDLVVAFLVSAPLVILLSRRKGFANPKINGLGSAFRASEREFGTSSGAAASKETTTPGEEK